MNLQIYLLLLTSILSSTRCSKILGIFPSPGYSQFILCEKIMTELANRGHEVTVISTFKPKVDVKNYKTILADGLVGGPGNAFLRENVSIFKGIFGMYMFGNAITEHILSHKDVQNLIHSNETFDLVLQEMFLNEAHMAFSKHFNAPLILFSSVGLSAWTAPYAGNIRLPSIEPLLFSPYTNHMTFIQRLHNSVLEVFNILCKNVIVYPKHQKLVTKYFPNDINLGEVMYNSSLMLLNSHPTTTHPSMLTSSIIEIGGFHISPKKLPKDIQKFLDEAKDGAVFFSLGGNVKTSDMSSEMLSNILKAFSKLKQRVLWKFHDSNVPNKPKNVLISNWLPQSDILAHPNTVAFITHGGFLSITESTYYGVPMVGVPLFGDQKLDIARSVERGIAVSLPLKKLCGETLYEAVVEVVDNPIYKMKSKEISDILKDQVVNPLELTMYWIEYVIRHPGAKHLRNSSLELSWYQLYLVDVIFFILLCFVIFYYSVKFLFKILRAYFKSDGQDRTKSKEKKTN